jgi:hypothetical protein
MKRTSVLVERTAPEDTFGRKLCWHTEASRRRVIADLFASVRLAPE